MICDSLSRLSLYQDLHPAIAGIVDYLKTVDLSGVPVGRHVLKEGIALLREDYVTRPLQAGAFEYHQKNADLQIVLKGKEIIAVVSKEHGAFRATIPFDEAKDVAKGDASGFTDVILNEGMFCLVYPHEIHQPKISVNEASAVLKAVFKIAL